jgi:hypothetical protein
MTNIVFTEPCERRDAVPNCWRMKKNKTFQRRGIVEGFFGPLWSMAQRKTLARLTLRRFGDIAPVRKNGCLNFLYRFS